MKSSSEKTERDATVEATLSIGGMTCANCKARIESRLAKLKGVISARVSLSEECAKVEFIKEKITIEEIISEIEELGYTASAGKGRAQSKGAGEAALYVALIALLFLFLQKTGFLNALSVDAVAARGMGYSLLFVTGLLTSVHCVAMCGGINLSQSLPLQKSAESQGKKIARSDFIPALLYNAGRAASYTAIGFALGAAGFFLGGAFKSGENWISFFAQGILKIAAGVFMVLMGISILGIFPQLRKITPRLPAFLSKKIFKAQSSARPFFVGLLNGFMPCGPLQAMWLVALASANPITGALSMLAFALGTLPLMLGLGSIISLLGKKYSGVVMKAGAVLVVVMGLLMMSQGFALGGFKSPSLASKNSTSPEKIVMQDGKQIVQSVLNPFRYPDITVKKSVPVHWEIEADKESLSYCNYRIIFRDLGFMSELGYGKNVIEFTPEKAGSIDYTCWMGMVRGTIQVVD